MRSVKHYFAVVRSAASAVFAQKRLEELRDNLGMENEEEEEGEECRQAKPRSHRTSEQESGDSQPKQDGDKETPLSSRKAAPGNSDVNNQRNEDVETGAAEEGANNCVDRARDASGIHPNERPDEIEGSAATAEKVDGNNTVDDGGENQRESTSERKGTYVVRPSSSSQDAASATTTPPIVPPPSPSPTSANTRNAEKAQARQARMAEMRTLESESLPVFIEAMWSFNIIDIHKVLRKVCRIAVHGGSYGYAAASRAEWARRADGIAILGEEFLAVAALADQRGGTDTARANLERAVHAATRKAWGYDDVDV